MKAAVSKLCALLSFLLGAMVLSALFHVNKIIIHCPPLPASYIFPFFIGGVVGLAFYLLSRRAPTAPSFPVNDCGAAGRSLESNHPWFCLGIFCSALAGALLLSALSALQKLMAGFPVKASAFVVPVAFGACFGILFGIYLRKLRIHQLLQAEALQERLVAHNRLQHILESLHDGVVVFDGQGRVELANPAALSLLGVAEAELEKVSIRDIFTRFIHPQGSFLDSGLPAAQIFIGEAITNQRTLRCKTTDLLNLESLPSGSALVLEDVTFEHKLEKLKTEFIVAAAHELKTPITALSGFSELLLEGVLDEEKRRECAALVHQSAWRVNRILDVLLDISRVESGHPLPLDCQPYSAEELVFAAQDICRQSQPPAQVEFSLSDPTVQLRVDLERMEQVFANLLSNAIKFSLAPVQVRVQGRREDDRYLFEVVDRGRGMSEAEQLRIFDKFFRADGSDTALGGIGLGMNLVKLIVEAHGGRVWVKSRIGEGTTVGFSLPLVVEAQSLAA